MTRPQRQAIQAGIDALIDYLDAITPDADLEPTLGEVAPGALDECEPDADEEPNLGAPEPHVPYCRPACIMRTPIGDQRAWSAGSDEDREHDTSDLEPALGAPEGTSELPGHWGVNSRSAFEDEEEGWDADWEKERDEREIPGYHKGVRLMEAA